MISMSLAPPPSSQVLYSSFRSHRAELEPPRLGPTISLSKSFPPPAWASLPTPPMSGSPPPDERTQPQQLAGHRRKRSDTPPSSTTDVTASQSAPVSAPLHLHPHRPGAHPSYEPGPGGPPIQPAPYASAYPTSQAFGYGPIPSMAGPSSMPQLHFGPGPISPRATRKTKAHVASACVNCKKKHLRCDNARPCNRCVATSKESTCFDVEHKKRGRPPLKPEEAASRRSFEAALSPLPGSLPDPSRRLPPAGSGIYSQPQPTFQRDIRPIQSSGLHDYGSRALLRPGPAPQSMYATPTVSSTPVTAVGTMIPPSRGYFNDGSSASSQPPTPYIISPPGYSSHGAEHLPRSMSPYVSGYTYHQPQGSIMPPSQSQYSYPMFPRATGHAGMPGENPVGMYGTSSLQLPPILPAPQGSFEPAMAQQQRQAQQQQQQHYQQHRQSQEIPQRSDEDTKQPDAKRPRMDIKGILDPRND